MKQLVAKTKPIKVEKNIAVGRVFSVFACKKITMADTTATKTARKLDLKALEATNHARLCLTDNSIDSFLGAEGLLRAEGSIQFNRTYLMGSGIGFYAILRAGLLGGRTVYNAGLLALIGQLSNNQCWSYHARTRHA